MENLNFEISFFCNRLAVCESPENCLINEVEENLLDRYEKVSSLILGGVGWGRLYFHGQDISFGVLELKTEKEVIPMSANFSFFIKVIFKTDEGLKVTLNQNLINSFSDKEFNDIITSSKLDFYEVLKRI